MNDILDNYSREVMTALTSENYEKNVEKYLLSYDMENWKIFTDNFHKLTPFEAERIIQVIEKKLDLHLIIDILSLAHIIGQSIALSNMLISRFPKVNLGEQMHIIDKRLAELLKSPIAEERRIGLFLAGYYDKSEFFDEIEKMSNYDVLFEDAYFALGLMSDPKVVELLGTKFMLNSKNQLQRKAIARILIQKGNPLAALWLYRSKGFDFTISQTKATFLARELAWEGLKPANFINSNDDFLQPITIRFVEVIAPLLRYDLLLIEEIELVKVVKELLKLAKLKPSIDNIKALHVLKLVIEDIYLNVDPYVITKATRKHIQQSWKLLREFPNETIINYLNIFLKLNLDPDSSDFYLALRFIRNFKLGEYEERVLELARQEKLSKEQMFEIICCLGAIGKEKSLDFLLEYLQNNFGISKRKVVLLKSNEILSDIDYIDDFDNEFLEDINTSFNFETLKFMEADFDEIFYWNIIYLLGNFSQPQVTSVLIDSLNDYDPKIRYQAILSLQKQQTATPELEKKLLQLATTDPFMSVQREALLALGKFNSQKAIPIFIHNILDAIQNGVLEFANEIEQIVDNRWEVNEQDPKMEEDIGAKQKIREQLKNSEKSLVDKDIARWLKRFNNISSHKLELREDQFAILENDELDFTDESEMPTLFERTNDLEDTEEEWFDDDEENEWIAELGEQFKKLTIVEYSLDALKTTKAKIPLSELKELIKHPLDEELYKDLLIILAKNDVPFALNELLALFNPFDVYRAREIALTILQTHDSHRNALLEKDKEGIDWILKGILAGEKFDGVAT